MTVHPRLVGAGQGRAAPRLHDAEPLPPWDDMAAHTLAELAVWAGRPFCDGYGRTPDGDDVALLCASYVSTAVWHLVWSREHGEARVGSAVRDNLHALIRGDLT